MTTASTPTTPASPVRVLVAEDDDALHTLAEHLAAAGHEVIARVATGRAAVEQAARLAPEVVLLDVHMRDGSGIDAAKEIVGARPGTGVVFVTGDENASLGDDDVARTAATAFLPKPTPRALLDATVRLAAARARDLTVARADAAAARQQLEDRKLIERAKGILMRRTGSSEQEAYRILQRTSQDRAVPMTKIARAVLDSEPGAVNGGR